MMVEFVNSATGTKMWVAEERVEEYKAAGHKPAVNPAPTKEPEKRKKKEVKK